MNLLTLLQGNAIEQIRTLPDASVQCCVTSPPYWGLRDYGVAGQIGLEKTPEEYVSRMVEVFREVRRVLREDGTLWLNLGDCYCSTAPSTWGDPLRRRGPFEKVSEECAAARKRFRFKTPSGLKPKDLVGVAWRVAFALQADGWYLRSDIIWHKPNPMPESVTDRPTKAHEYLFLMAKSASYYYNAKSIQESSDYEHRRGNGAVSRNGTGRKDCDRVVGDPGREGQRNKRTVWTIPTMAYAGAHFATFPTNLISPCVLAGSKHGDTVLDPFAGSGTTAQVALELGRKAVLIELNPKYCDLIRQRCNVTPGLALA